MTADVHALAGAYALDALPPEERAFFERHLAACPACRDEVAELVETASQLGAAAAERPPDGLRDRVLAAADVTRQLPPETPAAAEPATAGSVTRMPGRAGRVMMGVAACLALVAVALGGVSLELNRRLNGEQARDAEVVGILAAPDLETVELDMGTEAPGRFMFSSSRDQGVLVAQQMAEPAPDQTLQLWLIHDGTPVPAGTFRPDRTGAAVAAVSGTVRGAEVVAITLEPAGGSEEPTGAVLASADL